ncbi:hypothetical protein FNV43_RR27125 [Rhamnella rubrinervis]|uniref:C-JID domain-containing protein n=1 Tax=Rhamnella rubrinervis TaxID=2594499 RepID=A0A8K0GS89_9ROSA|nr:hypothetical protein FNV43_RR27125 [Rhamnella rubrinervis]
MSMAKTDITVRTEECQEGILCEVYHLYINDSKVQGHHVYLHVGRFIVSYLPKDLFDDKSWVGFSLYVVLKMRPSDLHKIYSDSETPPVLHIDMHSHGSSITHITTFTDLSILPHSRQIFLFNAPRVYFTEKLNQCWGVSTLFRTSIPDWEIQMCGIRVIYEQDLGDVVNMITECELNTSPDDEHQESRYQAYVDLVQNLLCQFESHEPNMRKAKMPIHSREFESPQTSNFLLSTQPMDKQVLSAYKKFCVPRDPIAVHSKKFLLDYSKQVIEESSRDSAEGLVHLQIMAETGLYENDEYLIKRWKDNLKVWLPFYVRHYSVIITLSIKGRNICLLKPFNPFNTYNLCFPRKEIIDWFEGYQFSNRRVAIALPPNLKSDENWRGIAVCVAFSVQEHPNAIFDDQDSEVSSFGLLCHLSTDQKCCLNPFSTFRITKDKFKWSCVGGFIWLTYIPSCLLIAELNDQSHYIEVDIYNECTGVTIQNLGAHLLFQQHVEEFRQSITQCMTSFFDNVDAISQFLADENEKPSHPCSTATSCEDGNSYMAAQQENLTEFNFLGKKDFDPDMVFNLCFPSESQEMFRHYNRGPAVTIQLPSELYCVGNCIGLALCAYFIYPNKHSSTIFNNFDLEIPHYLVCYLETERVSLESLHHYRITNDEFDNLDHGEFIWLSYIPRSWFSTHLDQSTLIETSFASNRPGLRVLKCGLRLLCQNDEEEIKQTINQCMRIKYENERSKQKYHDDHEVECSKSTSSADGHQQEGLVEGPNTLINLNNQGKNVLQ